MISGSPCVLNFLRLKLVCTNNYWTIYQLYAYPISFPEHARSQVKGGHSSGEIELIQACDWLTADNTLDFQREFYINKVFGISRRKCYTFYTEID